MTERPFAFRTVKVFEDGDMPTDVRRAFHDSWQANFSDEYTEWELPQEKEPEAADNTPVVDGWLMANGADWGERVLIRCAQ